jgi:hypothetical protein
MNRNTGIVGAITLAVIAILGFSSRPAEKGASPASESGQPSRPSNGSVISQAPVQNLQAPCREIGLRISEFIVDGAVTPPDSCKEDSKQDAGKLRGAKVVPPLQPPQVHYIIATLPDPVHTHFPLLFDRLTEALQQAAQDQGFSYDGSWLPWSDDARTYGSLKDQQTADGLQLLQDRQPGVLVFRKSLYQSDEWTPCGTEGRQRCLPGPYSEGLIVFVAGEDPTGGIHREQFQNAVDWIRNLSANGSWEEVRILGPYFSGSFPSLAQALLANHLIKSSEPPLEPTIAQTGTMGSRGKQGPKKPATGVSNPVATAPGQHAPTKTGSSPGPKSMTIFSGSVSSKTGIDWFTQLMENSPGRFYSFQENDDVMIDRYCQYLSTLGYDTGKLAIMSETETAYGVIPSTLPTQNQGPSPWLPDCDESAKQTHPEYHGPLYLYYPRDIASLRSAYEQQSSGGGTSPGGAGLGLPMDLAEHSSRQRDTIRNFGGKQTPLSQEATLFGITNLFRAHDIQFIVLRSSNSLDQVFLTRFLARAYPQARVVLTGADLLLRRSSETAGFRGTMMLTTYPLLTWQQDWTYWQQPESRHSHRAFSEDFTEGLYLATRFLIEGKADRLSNATPDGHVEVLSLPTSSVVIQDYGPPSWLLPKPLPDLPNEGLPWPSVVWPPNGRMATRPPTWLSVIGNEQFWPVAVLDERTVPLQAPKPPTSTLPFVEMRTEYHPAEFLLPLTMFVCCVVILFWGCWHFFCCFFGSHASLVRLRWLSFSMPSSRILSYFAPVPRWQHKVLVFIGCIIMGVMAILVATTTDVISRPLHSPLNRPISLAVYCAIIFILSLAALVGNYRILLRRKWRFSPAPIGEDCSTRRSVTGRKNLSVTSSHTSRVEQLKNMKDRIKVHTNVKVQRIADRINRTIKKHELDNQNLAAPRIDYFSMAVGGACFLSCFLLLGWTFHRLIIEPLSLADRTFALWRSINLFTGVSPLLPLLFLAVGLYAWFWHSLSGLTLFNAGRSKLPPQKYLDQCPMCSREQGGRRIEHAAIPLNRNYCLCFVSFVIPYTLVWWLSGQSSAVHALGPMQYGTIYFVWLSLLIVLSLTETWIMLRTWARLRKLLLALDRWPLRRTLLALKALSWGTVWKMGGNVIEQRDRLIALQEESLLHLENEINILSKAQRKDAGEEFDEMEVSAEDAKALNDQFAECNKKRYAFDNWFARYDVDERAELPNSKAESNGTPKKEPNLNPANLQQIYDFQEALAATAGVVFVRILKPAWDKEVRSLVLDSSLSAGKASPDKPAATAHEHVVMAAEEFFCLPYVGFIQNILGRIRTMTFSATLLFIAATFSVACFPFDPRPLLGATFIALFVMVAAVVIFVYAEMHRDPTLSYITNTDPDKLGIDFWIKVIGFGIGPLVGLLTALFPEITGFLTSWLQPGVQVIK